MTTSAELPVVDPSARVTRIDSPIASPGQCGLCGKNEHPLGFADARLDFEFYGTLYLCEDCVGDFARAFGYISPEELSFFRQHVEAQDTELRTLRAAVLNLESLVDNLTAFNESRNTTARKHFDGGLDRKPESNKKPEVATTEPDSAVKQPISSGETPVEQVNKSSSEQRPNDLPDSTNRLLGL